MNFELNVTAMLMSYESDAYPFFLLFSCVCISARGILSKSFQDLHLSETKQAVLSLVSPVSSIGIR